MNISEEEINKFHNDKQDWWNREGPAKPLHQINPLRLEFIHTLIPVIENKKILDIGCGGGILAEALAKKGADVTGIDVSQSALNAANQHKNQEKIHNLEYVFTRAEDLAAHHSQDKFDIITCMEMLEHVPDPESIIKAAAQMLKPQGTVFFSTLNRTLKSYLFSIIGAEYILKLLPTGTHDYAKFIKPSELAAWARENKLVYKDITGINYNPLSKQYSLTANNTVNYIMAFTHEI